MTVHDEQAQIDTVEELIDEIQSVTVADKWSIDTDLLLSIIQMDKEEYYRLVYAKRHSGLISLHIRDSYDDGITEELLEILDVAGLEVARPMFEKSGYSLSSGMRDAWVEFFLSVSLSRIQNHELDVELLKTCLSGCSNPADGIESYIHSTISINDLVSFAAVLFLRKNRIEDHHLSRSILSSIIADQIKIRDIKEEELFSSYRKILHEKAINRGIIEESEKIYTAVYGKLTERQKDALHTLGYTAGVIPASANLKKRYREMVKKNHPDINPGGEAITREITGAYNLLISEIYG